MKLWFSSNINSVYELETRSWELGASGIGSFGIQALGGRRPKGIGASFSSLPPHARTKVP